MAEDIRVRIEADAAPFLATLENLKSLSTSFGAELTGALKGAAVSGRSLDDILRRLASNLAGRALNLGLAPLRQMAGSMMSGLFGGAASVVPFAKGGVVASPSYFPMGHNLGLMGEAGAEAILPLARGADGRLGVAAGGSTPSVHVTFNVTATDAASFRKSEAQVTGMLAQAVRRGTRGL
ncbi:phage tail tape measure protein [Tianweitania sediminis]|uniref:Phage tail tape measure protein n=1 Tax=Tianweitania sediminis TaxID=1502156 RepID=A0A8J7UIH1_9HYPH|nr:phage tail tape measure protein [Tianweitania sediminis]MBP0438903.1 phage tail tape measure protein [Tianweitania sediminis]